MNTRAVRCLVLPPFRHDWRLVENLDKEERQSANRGLIGSFDPTYREFEEFHMRCDRCGADQWWQHSDAPPAGLIRPLNR